MEYLTLQNIWDNAYINCPIWWEHNQEEVSELVGAAVDGQQYMF